MRAGESALFWVFRKRDHVRRLEEVWKKQTRLRRRAHESEKECEKKCAARGFSHLKTESVFKLFFDPSTSCKDALFFMLPLSTSAIFFCLSTVRGMST